MTRSHSPGDTRRSGHRRARCIGALALLLSLAGCSGASCFLDCAGGTVVVVPLYQGPIDLSGVQPVMPRTAVAPPPLNF